MNPEVKMMDRVEAANHPTRYSYSFLIIVALFITSLMTANIISVKLIKILGMVLPAGIIIFPISTTVPGNGCV